MSEDVRRVTTDEQRAWCYGARDRGGLCAACGRTLAPGEPVYVERFVVGQAGSLLVGMQASVGRECASAVFLEEMEGQETARCAGCGRPVYHRAPRPTRSRVICSKPCGRRANATKRVARAED